MATGHPEAAQSDETEPAAAERSHRRRWVVVATACALAVAALSPISPVSPFRPDGDGERVAAPERDGEARTGTTSPRERRPPPPEPTLIPPATVLPTTTAPPPTTPPPPPVPQPAPIAGTDHGLVFADDFDGGAPGAAWVTAPFGNSLPATVADGVLTLKTTAANEHQWGYIASTGPRSESEPNYPLAQAWQNGYFEARVRYSDNRWSWPAFWLFSMAKTEAWPHEDCSELTAELDIMENGIQNSDGRRPAGSWYFTALHRNTSRGPDLDYCGTPDEARTHGAQLSPTNLASWHTWAALWTEDQICTYVDGTEIQCMEPWDSTSQPMHLVFTMQYLGRCDGCPARPPELELQVDWVRVWQTS